MGDRLFCCAQRSQQCLMLFGEVGKLLGLIAATLLQSMLERLHFLPCLIYLLMGAVFSCPDVAPYGRVIRPQFLELGLSPSKVSLQVIALRSSVSDFGSQSIKQSLAFGELDLCMVQLLGGLGQVGLGRGKCDLPQLAFLGQ